MTRTHDPSSTCAELPGLPHGASQARGGPDVLRAIGDGTLKPARVKTTDAPRGDAGAAFLDPAAKVIVARPGVT